MTPTPDIARAELPELCVWLAELPCPGRDANTACTFTLFCTCQGLGLAFPWVSAPCPRKPTFHGHTGCGSCNGSGRVPKAVGLEELVLILAAPDGTYIVDVETNWDCPHEFATAGEDEDQHLASPCSEATFACMVTRGRDTAYELFGQADGPVLDTNLLTLAALRAVAAQAKAGMR